MRNPTSKSLPKVLEETLDFTEPFIHFDRLEELGLVKEPGNGGAWRAFNKYYRFTVVYTTKRKPLHTNTIQEDKSRFESLEGSYTNLKDPKKGKVLGLFIWGGRTSSNTRYIPVWIRERVCYKGARCLICDTDREIQCDHVDDDYPYIPPDKLKVSDFQALCQSCNHEKREASKKEQNNKKEGFYYRDVKDPSKSVIRLLFGLPSDFVFPLLDEERIGKVRFYRNPQLVRKMHINHLIRIICLK